MQAVVFELSLPRYALAKSLGRFSHEFYHGRASCLSMRDIPRPALPGPEWARLETLASGVCGSDIGAIYLKSSPSLEPFNSFPCVLGHEILARVEEIPEGFALKPGDRVVVDTTLGCAVRGVKDPCRSCRAGAFMACERVTEGCLAPGMTIGYHKDLPGGWCPEIVAPARQLFQVPDNVPDRVAVLTEPLAIGLHGVLASMPRDDEHVLVIGGGMIAFAAIWALRALGSRARITQVALLPYQLEVGRALGADEGILGTRDDAKFASEISRLTGARSFRPLIGPRVFSGGFDLVIDCIGTSESVRDALRVAAGAGKVLLLGAAGLLKGVDWSFVWSRELTIKGSVGYGLELYRGEKKHTFEIVLELLSSGTAPDVAPLVTHIFPLTSYREAIIANIERGTYRSVKTIFSFGEIS